MAILHGGGSRMAQGARSAVWWLGAAGPPSTDMSGAKAMTRGTLQQRKSLLPQLVATVEVSRRYKITPTFRIPATPVRSVDRVAGRCGPEPHTSAAAGSVGCGSKVAPTNPVAGVMV
jgi:hypothetical protein